MDITHDCRGIDGCITCENLYYLEQDLRALVNHKPSKAESDEIYKSLEALFIAAQSKQLPIV